MADETQVIIGIDAGTTSVKTVAFSLDGDILSVSRSTLHVRYGQRNEAEIGMDEVWSAVVLTVQAVLEALSGAEVLAMGVTGQGDGAWLVDDSGQPLRDAVLWLDGRAANRLETWRDLGFADIAKQTNGSDLFPGALPLLLEELAEADPSIVPKIGNHLNCKDWIKYRLTGIKATDPSEASRTYLAVGTGSYSDEFMKGVGQSAFESILPQVLSPETVQGITTPEATRILGLNRPVPVVVGLVDTAAAGLGLGALSDGDGYAIIGTTAFVGVNQPSRASTKTDIGILLETGRNGQVLECLSTMTGTPNLEWARETLGLEDTSWDEIEAHAKNAPPGAGGVMYLPYASPNGERAPFVDPTATASWHGLTITTDPSQLLRAVYEGVCFSISECLDKLKHVGTLTICGGGSESDLFCQILADASGRTVLRPDAPEAGARGVAAIALAAVGEQQTLNEAVSRLAPPTTAYRPEPQAYAIYQRVRMTFTAVRDALRPQWSAIRALRSLETIPQNLD